GASRHRATGTLPQPRALRVTAPVRTPQRRARDVVAPGRPGPPSAVPARRPAGLGRRARLTSTPRSSRTRPLFLPTAGSRGRAPAQVARDALSAVAPNPGLAAEQSVSLVCSSTWRGRTCALVAPRDTHALSTG